MSTLVASPPTLNAYLELDPEHPDDMRIVGTGLSVRHLYARYQAGERPEDFHESWPHVPLAAFYAAIGYYQASKERIDQELADEFERFMAMAEQHKDDPAYGFI